MNNNTKRPRYAFIFETHINHFIDKYSLIHKDTSVINIGVSAGVDSMALGLVIKRYVDKYVYSCKVCFHYIHHNTRKNAQDNELELVRKYAEHLKVDFKYHHVSGLNVDKNFEKSARDARYNIMNNEQGIFLLAHHIDDSFEWSQLQLLRSSNITSTLGIPVINGKYRRPFLCVTKDQIRKYAKILDLPFIEDPSNQDHKHERNYLRNVINDAFATRYMKYQKHYVYRHNELARRLGKHALFKSDNYYDVVKYDNCVEIFNMDKDFHPEGIEYAVLKAVEYLNPNGRGKLNLQIQKLISALRNNKQGPLSFSGNLKAYLTYNHILFVHSKHKKPIYNTAKQKRYNLEEFKDYLDHRLLDGNDSLFPYWIIVHGSVRSFTFNKRIHPYSEYICSELKRLDHSYTSALNLYRQWSLPKNRKKTLILSTLF